MVLVEPTITVRLNVALAVVSFNTSLSPPGVVWKLKLTVCGSSRRVSDRVDLLSRWLSA